jgi:diguanylate cyclase (GGDEF)-like protein
MAISPSHVHQHGDHGSIGNHRCDRRLAVPRSTGLGLATWLPLSLSYVARGLYWPLMSLVVAKEHRNKTAFLDNLKGSFTVSIFVDLMTAAVAMITVTLIDRSPVTLVPAGFVALTMAWSARARKETSQTAAHDELTGALNRRGFTTEFQRRAAAQLSGFLMILDIDQFKKVNDEFGHLAGDNVLRHLVDQVRTVLPADALLARLGGDEFVIAVFDADLVTLPSRLPTSIADAIQMPINELPGVRCAVSIGLASFESTDSLSDTMHRADRSMYTHKRSTQGASATSASRVEPDWLKEADHSVAVGQ